MHFTLGRLKFLPPVVHRRKLCLRFRLSGLWNFNYTEAGGFERGRLGLGTDCRRGEASRETQSGMRSRFLENLGASQVVSLPRTTGILKMRPKIQPRRGTKKVSDFIHRTSITLGAYPISPRHRAARRAPNHYFSAIPIIQQLLLFKILVSVRTKVTRTSSDLELEPCGDNERF